MEIGAHSLPVLGEGARWRRNDERGILFNMRNSEVGTAYDTSCAISLAPIPDGATTAYQIVSLRPELTYTADNTSIVHHMDLFVCDDNGAMGARVGRPRLILV